MEDCDVTGSAAIAEPDAIFAAANYVFGRAKVACPM
jgi:hypothetical protein